MATKQRKRGGGKLTRSEVIQVRLDPKLRFAAELAASKERRTLSSFIEWAVQQAVNSVEVTRQRNQSYTAQAVADSVWDVDEADRFVELAFQAPELLTHDEMRTWKFISETRPFWVERLETDQEGRLLQRRDPNKPVIRAAWGLICNHMEEEEPFDWDGFKDLEKQLIKSGITVDWGREPEGMPNLIGDVLGTESDMESPQQPTNKQPGE